MLKIFSGAEFLAADIPEPKFLLHPWLPEAGLAQIHAWTGVGKTLFSLGAAVAIATGTPFLRFTAQEPAPVLYLDGEMPAHLMQIRLANALKNAGHCNDFKFRMYSWSITNEPAPDLFTKAGRDKVDEIIGDAKVVFVDNLSALYRTPKENDDGSWLPWIEWIFKKRQAGIAVVQIHHDGKGRDERGSSKKLDGLDTIIHLTNPDDKKTDETSFNIDFTKHRHFWGDDAKSFEASLGDHGWSFGEIKQIDPMKLAKNLKNQGMPYRHIANVTGIPKSTLERNLKGLPI